MFSYPLGGQGFPNSHESFLPEIPCKFPRLPWTVLWEACNPILGAILEATPGVGGTHGTRWEALQA